MHVPLCDLKCFHGSEHLGHESGDAGYKGILIVCHVMIPLVVEVPALSASA
tara:strand:- start:242 stop:394 length:153 start_codon:yes stop_codon:yes gene_type:complete